MSDDSLRAMQKALVALRQIKSARWLHMAVMPDKSAVSIATEAIPPLEDAIKKFKSASTKGEDNE